MPIKLYMTVASPPVRATLLALKALNLPFEEQHVDMKAGDNMKEEFLKMNPAHTVPTLVDDDDVVIFDSHAINMYLVRKYAENDDLYPSDVKERSTVDQAMSYDCGTMFPTLRSIFQELCIKKTSDCITKEMVKKCEDIYSVLEKLLDGKDYIAKNGITIADFSVLTTLTTMNLMVAVDADKFPLVAAYMERCQSNIQACEEVNAPALEILRSALSGVNLQLPSD